MFGIIFYVPMYVNGFPVSYIFINIILGIIPFFLCFLLFKLAKQKTIKSRIIQFFVFITWLLFAPNAPYILTDMRHINGFCPNTVTDICVSNAWMIPFYFVFSIIAWVLYFYVIEQMRIFIKKYYSLYVSRIFPIIISPILALGLLVGLVDRFNSWDILIRPIFVVNGIIAYIIDIEKTVNFLVFTFMLIVLYYFAKIIFKPIENIKILEKTLN